MVDDAQRERPHKIDKKEVESKRAMPREVSQSNLYLVQFQILNNVNCIFESLIFITSNIYTNNFKS